MMLSIQVTIKSLIPLSIYSADTLHSYKTMQGHANTELFIFMKCLILTTNVLHDCVTAG